MKKGVDEMGECVYNIYSLGGHDERHDNNRYAPLAQLVEHLTLNQGVQGSSP